MTTNKTSLLSVTQEPAAVYSKNEEVQRTLESGEEFLRYSPKRVAEMKEQEKEQELRIEI